jgi:hypothetical protein
LRTAAVVDISDTGRYPRPNNRDHRGGLQKFFLSHHDARTVPKYRTYSVGLLGTITVSWDLKVHPAHLIHRAPPDDPQYAPPGDWADTGKSLITGL